MRVTVTRAFCLRGIRQDPGTSLEVPDPEGREWLARGIARRADPGADPGPAKMTTETAAGLVAGGKPKGR